MKDLTIFLSYSNNDRSIVNALDSLIWAAFSPVLADVFKDDRVIGFGTDIKKSVEEGLRKADILIAVALDGAPASVFSWATYELATFRAFWDEKIQPYGEHASRAKEGLIGKAVTLCNKEVALGPEQGIRVVKLGISDRHLSVQNTGHALEMAREAAALEDPDILNLLEDIESLVSGEPEYIRFKENRKMTLDELVKRFKTEVFDILRRNVRTQSKPTKQLLVKTNLKDGKMSELCTISSVAGGAEIFDLAESGSTVFERVIGGVGIPDRFETTWKSFAEAVAASPYGPYWCAAIEQAVYQASVIGGQIDPNLVLISRNGTRFRIIITTIKRYFDNYIEISLYFVEALKRRDLGDPVTTRLLSCLNLLSRFRFAFLEASSPYYWRNFKHSEIPPKDLLMELDYLRSEAANANIDNPGSYEEFLGESDLSAMMETWSGIELALRQLCSTAVEPANAAAGPQLRVKIVDQLQRISKEINHYNAKIGEAVSQKILEEFKHDVETSKSDKPGGRPALAE